MDNIAYFMILLPTIFFIGICSTCAQYSGGSKCFYGVKIDGLNLSKEYKDNIKQGYKKNINILSVVLLLASIVALYALEDSFEMIMNAIVFIYVASILLSQFVTYRKVKKITEELIRNTGYKEDAKYEDAFIVEDYLLDEKSKLKNKFRFAFLILLFISVISILYLVMNYNELPKFIPTDFSGDLTPTDFVAKNLKSVFGLEIAGFVIISLLGFITISCVGNVDNIRKDKLETESKKILKYINKIGVSFILITLGIEFQTNIIPIILFNKYNFPIFVMIPLWFLIGISLINILYSYTMLSSFKEKQKFNYSTDDSKWILGYFYFNKEDKTFMVENKIGMGYTINLAHKKVGVFIAGAFLFLVMNMTLNML